MKIQTVYIPTKDLTEFEQPLIDSLDNFIYKKEVFVFTPEELKQVLSNAWNDGRNGTEFIGNFPFTSNRYINHSSEQYIENFLNKEK